MIAAFVLAVPAALMNPPLPPTPRPPVEICLPKGPVDGFDRFRCDNRIWA